MYTIKQFVLNSHVVPPLQDDVGQLSKLAYADLNHFLPDFEMKNGKPRQINQCAFQESRMVEPKFTDQIQGHMDPNFAGLIQGNMDQKSNSLHFFFMHLTMVVDTNKIQWLIDIKTFKLLQREMSMNLMISKELLAVIPGSANYQGLDLCE